MKKIIASFFAVFLFSLALAQTSPKLSYQAVVRNASNELVAGDTITVSIRFHNHDLSGSAVYSERHSVVSNRNGLISLVVGEGEEATGSLSQVTWNDVLVSTEITLQDGYSVTDVKPVTAVPFACYAEQIPLQALEEHLGSTNFVSAEALRDTLANRATITALSDSLASYVPRTEWETALQNLRSEMGAVTSTVDNITVTSSHVTSNQFVLGHTPLNNREVMLFINGILIGRGAYSLTGDRMLYLPVNNGNKELEEGDRIQIYYYYK